MTEPEDGFLVPPALWQQAARLGAETGAPGGGEQLLITKHTAYIHVSNELLMDMGVIPDTREHKPIPRHTRLRWWLGGQRLRAAELAYRLIAGYDVPDGDR